MAYQNDDDDDTLIYDSGPSKTELWREIVRLRDRIRELEGKVNSLEKSEYFGER